MIATIFGWLLAIPGKLKLYAALALGGVAAFLGAYLKGRRDAKVKAEGKAAKDRLKTKDEVAKHEREAETQDDASLVDRLTRR